MMNGGAAPQYAHLLSYILSDYAMIEQHHHHYYFYYYYSTTSTSTATQGAELCNPRADKARFGEIWEAEIPLKLPVLLLWKFNGWKSHGIGLGWI